MGLREALISAVEKHLGEDAKRSGSVLYNGWSTLHRGKVYLMGFNPGGDPATIPQTVIQTLREMKDEYCSYTDEEWSGEKRKYSNGGHPHQRRVKTLVEVMGCDIGHVFAANAIFVRSKEQDVLRDAAGLWNKCWPVHQTFLSIVQPRIILCLGNGNAKSSFTLLRSKCDPLPEVKFCGASRSFRDGKYFSGKAKIDKNGTLPALEYTVVGVPHPSRFKISKTLENFLRTLAGTKNIG